MAVPPAPWEGSIEEFQMLKAAMSEAHLVLHGPPDFPQDAEIIGVCAVSAENADQNKYGWMVADFLRWKMLLHGASPKQFQTWLSSLDIPKFLAGIDGVDIVSEDTLDKILGKQRGDIVPIPPNDDSEVFATTFLHSLTGSARCAASRRTTLVVIVFAPVTPEQDIWVDLGQKKTYLFLERLRQTIIDAVNNVQLPVILVTPSPFTGGWLCRPSFLNPQTYPSPDKMWRIIARSCGGAFADRFITSFTDRSTPLMTQYQRAQVKYDDPMPLRPSDLQVDCLHQFQRQIHESLEHRLSVFARDHAFILEPNAACDPTTFSDSWTEYGPRHGRRMEHWAGHWSIPRPVVDDTNRFKFLGEAFGGTKESQVFHLQYLAAMELETFPGDWTRHVGGATRELFTSFLQRMMPGDDDVKRVFDAIEFRASSVILAHVVAAAFSLPLPGGVKCRYWHDKTEGVSDEYYSKLQYAFGCALPLFGQPAMLPSEKRHEFKDVRFLRSARWLAAATALRFEKGSRQDIESFISKDVARFIAKIRDTQKMLLLEDPTVQRKGLNWIAALGLGGEVQMSPTMNPTLEAKVAQLSIDGSESRFSNDLGVSAPAAILTTNGTGPVSSSGHGVSGRTAFLAAQAAPWPVKSQGETPLASAPVSPSTATEGIPNQRGEQAPPWAGSWRANAGEPESSRKRQHPGTLKHIMTEWGALDSVKDNLQGGVTQRASVNKDPEEIRSAASTAISAGETQFEKVEGNMSVSAIADTRPQNLSHAGFAPNATDGNVDSRPLSSGLDTQGEPAEAGMTPEHNGGEASPCVDPNNGFAAWDDVIDTPSATNGHQIPDNTAASFQKSVEPHPESKEKPDDPFAAVSDDSAAWERILCTPSAPVGQQAAAQDPAPFLKSEETHSPSKEKRENEPLAPSTTDAPQPPAQQSTAQPSESSLIGFVKNDLGYDPSILVRLLPKTVDMMEQELANKSAGSQSETRAAEDTSLSVQASGTSNETPSTVQKLPAISTETLAMSWAPAHGTGRSEPFGTATEKAVATSTDVPVSSWEPAQGTGQNDHVETVTEQTVAASNADLHEASSEATMGRSDSTSPDCNAVGLNIYDATPPRTPVAGRPAGMETFGDSADDVKSADTVQETAVQGTHEGGSIGQVDAQADGKPSLAEHDDFWARAGIQW